MAVRTRIAPSPTGSPHVGTAYQALFDYAFAKKHQGRFILRIEDTDKKRQARGAEEEIRQGLEWLGLLPDESPWQGGEFAPYRQSERLPLYQKYARQLVEQGDAYYCFCSPNRLAEMRRRQLKNKQAPRYDRHCRQLSPEEVEKRLRAGDKFVIRLKVPLSGTTTVRDPVRGEIVFQNQEIDDQVLLKSDGFPTYHLAVAVDDHLMKITHPVRGEEWISSYPKHKLIYQALGWEMPLYTHTSILRGTKREKLGKRFGHSSLSWFRREGYLPEATLNYLALLGWSHPEGKDFFSLEEFIEKFDLRDLLPVAPVFDLQKLRWLNGEWIRSLSSAKLLASLQDYARYCQLSLPGQTERLLPLARERMAVLKDFFPLCEFLLEERFLANRRENQDKVRLTRELTSLLAKELEMSAVWQESAIKEAVFAVWQRARDAVKKKDFFVSLYILVTGKPVGLPLFGAMEVLGREKTLKRLTDGFAFPEAEQSLPSQE